MYGNYLENFDMKDGANNDISVKFEVVIVQNPDLQVVPKEPQRSIKSVRTYQIGVVYRDKFGNPYKVRLPKGDPGGEHE